MKILGNLIKILVAVLLVYILIQNVDQRVNVRFFTLYYPQTNLSIIMLLALGVGAILGAVMMSFSVLQSRSEIRNLERKNKKLTQELENLRNISIDEIPEDDLTEQSEKQS